MTFARHQFTLSQPQQDGTPLIAHLERVRESTGEEPAFLADAPAVPVGCASLWADFLELHSSRGSTGWGPQRITFVDLEAWQRVRGAQLNAWEIDCIIKADNMWLAEFAPKPKADK